MADFNSGRPPKIISEKDKCKAPNCKSKKFTKGFCKKHHKELFIDIVSNPSLGAISGGEIPYAPREKEETKKEKIKLSDDQMLKVYLTPCKTKADLKNFLKYFFGLHLPDVKVSRYADMSPFDFLWSLYEILVLNHNPKKISEIIACAGRGSGKTLVVSIAQLLSVIHGKRDVVHVGGIEAQAKRAYDYIQGYLSNANVKDLIDPPRQSGRQKILRKSIMEKTILDIDSQLCSIEILPCTMKAVNGPHVNFVTVDEIDTISGEGAKAYKDIAGMLDSKNGIMPLRVNISTRKTRHGLMEKQMASAEAKGKTVIKWTILEFLQRCTEERSGSEKASYFVEMDSATVLSPAAYEKLPLNKKNEFELIEAYSNCNKCPLLPWCRGDARNQESKSPMLKSIDEVAAKALGEGPDWTAAQLFNLKPSAEGVVFKEFEVKTHVKTWNEMWLTLTGKNFPGTCDHDTFVAKCKSLQLRCYAGIDFGWTNPNTILYLFVDGADNVYIVMCDGRTQTSAPEWMHFVKTKYNHTYQPHLYFIDTVDPGNIMEMRKIGLPVTGDTGKAEINTGVQLIKKWLRYPGGGEPKIFMNEGTCKPIIKELQTYHYKSNLAGEATDDYDKGDDHWIDPLRYIFVKIFARSAVMLTSDSVDRDGSLIGVDGSMTRNPSLYEVAAMAGSRINLQDTTSSDKIGRVGRFDEIENPQEQEGGGSSGFIFSF